jgi:hypothetical protein
MDISVTGRTFCGNIALWSMLKSLSCPYFASRATYPRLSIPLPQLPLAVPSDDRCLTHLFSHLFIFFLACPALLIHHANEMAVWGRLLLHEDLLLHTQQSGVTHASPYVWLSAHHPYPALGRHLTRLLWCGARHHTSDSSASYDANVYPRN